MQGLESSLTIDIPFQDVDMFSIVWHGNYARYFEQARCHFLDEIDYNYLDMKASGFFFPLVDLKIRYIKPIVFGQRIVVRVRLKEWQHWLRLNYLISDCGTGERLTKGSTRQVAVELHSGKMLDTSPQVLLHKLAGAAEARAVASAAQSSTARQGKQ